MSKLVRTTDDDSGGNPSLDGWFYQCDVSVWAALDLLVVKRTAKVLQLEPASQEDLEAELASPRVASRAEMAGTRLVVQAKLRRSGQWTPASLKKMVEHGTKRESALKRLTDETVTYVLVTSADVSGPLTSMLVDDFLEVPQDGELPSKVFPTTHVKKAAGRFAILGQFSEARVVERINALLFSPLCVPSEKHDACRAELRRLAMAGMRKGLAWARSDVEAVIKAYDGSIPSERDVQFVEPTNWDDIVAHMDKRHAIVITGPSGTGKTTVAKALHAHYKRIVPGLNYVEPSSPAEIRDRSGIPTLFYVEDPWGKYEIKDGTVAWSSGLEDKLPKVTAQQMIVVTSRADILAATVGSEGAFLTKWEVRLDASKYGETELGRMYEARVRDLGSVVLKSAAVRAKGQVLRQLQTPFEIDRFVSLLRVGASPSDENESMFVSRVLNETQTNAIEVEVQRLVMGSHLERAAVVVWGLMAARAGLTRQDLPTIRRAINRLDPSFADGLELLVNALVAGGNLRQPGSEVTYAHPRVEKGLVRVILAKPALAESTLSHLATALVRMSGQAGRQGVETAARLYSAMRSAKEPYGDVTDEVRGAIDAWLEEALGQDQEDYAGLLRLAAIVGSSACVPAEIARWLKPASTGSHFFIRGWTPGTRTDEWYAKVQAHRSTIAVCERFIRLVLTVETRGYPSNMAIFLDKIATGLDTAWATAGMAAVQRGYDANVLTVAFGAMRAAQNREPLLQAALRQQRLEDDTPQVDSDYWPYVDDHYNGDWDHHYDDRDDGYGARELISAFAEATREDLGWQALAQHPDVADLGWAWFEALKDLEPAEVTDEEIVTLFGLVGGGSLEERIWLMLTKSWRPVFEARLRARLLEESDCEDRRLAAAGCALEHAPQILAQAAQALFDDGQLIRLIELAYDAKACTKFFENSEREEPPYEAFESGLPSPFGEMAGALTPLENLQETRLSSAALDALVPMLGQHLGNLRVLLIWLAAVNKRADEATIQAALTASVQPDEADVVVRAAAVAGCWSVVRQALSHPRAKARKRALEFLVVPDEQEIPEDVLALVGDPSSSVRRAVLQVLVARPARYKDELVRLSGDRWSHDSVARGEVENHPIARAAAKALLSLPALPPEYTEPLVETALETEDLELCESLFTLLIERGDEQALAEVVNQVFTIKPSWTSVAAAEALARTRRKLHATSLTRANARWFQRAHPSLVAAVAEAVGNCTDSAQVLATAREFAKQEDRRVLLIALALGAERQSADLAKQVLEMLPPEHLAIEMLTAAGVPLKHDALDDLGDVRTVNAVHLLCGSRIASRPSVMDLIG